MYGVPMISSAQVRMARAALRWSVRELAERAGITANTVSRYENGADALGETLTRIERVLEEGGVIFENEDEFRGPGVRLRDRLQR